MKSYIAHYRNKYPSAQVIATDVAIRVISKDGELLVALDKNGAGQWQDVSEELGALDCHDLAPIERKFRAHKLSKDGKLCRDEEYDARILESRQAEKDEGKVHSEDAWKKIKAKRAFEKKNEA